MTVGTRVALVKPEVKKEKAVNRTHESAKVNPSANYRDQMLYLQRTIGNQALLKMINSGTFGGLAIQTKKQEDSRDSKLYDIVPEQSPEAPEFRSNLFKDSFIPALEREYGIVIESGDKEWNYQELRALRESLGLLTERERAVIKDYHFQRWEHKGGEAGSHQDHLIILNDNAFKKAKYRFFAGDKEVGKAPVSYTVILHEIAHALAVYNYQKLKEKDSEADGTEKQRIRRKLRAMNKGESVVMLNEFRRLTQGMKPVSDYAKTDISEAFAETFMMFKLNPEGLKSRNPKLVAWFEKLEFLESE